LKKAINPGSPKPLKNEVRKRLEFIEFQLFWYGSLQRKALTEAFEISGFQATKDIKLYLELVSGNIHYDTSDKCYYPLPRFKPQFHEPNVDNFLNGFNFGNEFSLPLTIETLRLPTQSIDLSILRQLVQAIINKKTLSVRYLSLGGDSDKWRKITPTSFSNSGSYWDVRCFCHIDKTYKFFSCGRLIDSKKKSEDAGALPNDLEWETVIELKLGFNSKLTQSQKNILKREYRAQADEFAYSIRLAHYYNFRDRLQSGKKPNESLLNPLKIINAEEIEILQKQIVQTVYKAC